MNENIQKSIREKIWEHVEKNRDKPLNFWRSEEGKLDSIEHETGFEIDHIAWLRHFLSGIKDIDASIPDETM